MKKLKNYQNYLILQTAFIGDVALSLFFAEALKKINPNSKILFITTKTSAELVECSKSVEKVIVFDKKKTHKKLSQVKKFAAKVNENYKIDIVFALHKSLRSAILAKLINAKYKVGFNKNTLSFLLNKRVKYKKNLHEVDRNMQLLSAFDEYNSEVNYRFLPEFSFNNQVENELFAKFPNLKYVLADKNKQKFVAIAIGSVWATKKWKYEYFLEVTSKLKQKNYEVILIGSKSEQLESENIAAATNSITLAGKTTIPETLQILKNAELLISNDSAPTHFASILNIPTITIFGPTSPIFGFSPLAEKSFIAEDENLFCRPCSIHGGRKCPRKTHQCMTNVTPKQILELACKILG